MEAAEIKVRADGDWLVGNHMHRVRDAGTVRRKVYRGLIRDHQRVQGRDSYGAVSALTGVGSCRIRSGNGHAGQVVPMLVQEVHSHVGGRRAPVEDIDVTSGVTTGVGKKRRRADPDKRRSARRGARRALWPHRTLWALRTSSALRTLRTCWP